MLEIGNHKIRTPAVCASILHENLDSMESAVEKAIARGVDLIELRLDKLEETKGWEKLLQRDMPMIVTNRAIEEGGHFEGGEGDRIRLLIGAIEAGASCIDIELSTAEDLRKKVLRKADEGETSTILSFHEFENVPPIKDLMKKGRMMEKVGCDISKIIGFSNNSQEAVSMLDFLIQSSEELEISVIAFAMGEKGKFTRLASTLLGSPFTYASMEEKTAPGQLGVSEVKDVLEKYRY